jgi:hypothetical protein
MFDSIGKFNTPKYSAQEKPKERPGEFQERSKPLTENEQCILDNLTKTARWFDEELKDLNNQRLNPGLAKYMNEFESQQRQIERPAEEAEILEEAAKSDIVFFGDYHHLSKSQDFVAETIEKIARASTRPSVLAIEFVEHSKFEQRALDDYLSGKISEEEFLKKINFKNWDNPEHWSAYKHILESAKRSGIKVCGINTDRKEKTLNKTDEEIAINLQKIAQQNPGARILLHIGEDHLSENHLPQKLAALDEFKQKKSITLFQNLPSIYFDALKKYKNFHIPKSFKLQGRSSTYNLITAPLITKLVADIEYLQFSQDDEEDQEFLSADDRYELVKRMVAVLNLKKREDKYNCVPPIYSTESEIETELKKMSQRKIFKPYLKTLKEKGSVYVPGSKDKKHNSILIITRFRLKKVLEELAKFIANPDKKVDDFAQLSPAEQENLKSFQYLCSKVFIPERIPETEEEKEGEKMFRDFLAGKEIEPLNL